MKKSYCGNLKPFASVLLDRADSEKILPVLEKISSAGKELCLFKGRPKLSVLKRSSAVLAFFTQNSIQSTDIQNAVLSAKNAGIPVIPVLENEKTELPELLRPFFGASNAVFFSRYDANGLADRLLNADALKMDSVTPAQKKAFKTTVGILVAAAVLVLSAAAMLLFKIPSSCSGSSTSASSAPASEEDSKKQLDAAEKFGFTVEDLNKIQQLYIVGGYRLSSNETSDLMQMIRQEWEWEDQSGNDVMHYVWESDTYAPSGSDVQFHENIDLSFLPLMKNLRELVLIQENISELPDLSGLEKLTDIQLSFCPLENITGLNGCKKLRRVTLEHTNVTDLSPLNNCESIISVTYMDKGQDGILQSLGTFAPQSLKTLYLQRCNKLKDLSSLSGCSSLTALTLDSNEAEDFSFLGKHTALSSLMINQPNISREIDLSVLNSISSLREINLSCKNVKDLSFLENNTSLESICLNLEGNVKLPPLKKISRLLTLSLNIHGMKNLDFLEGLDTSGLGYMRLASEHLNDLSGLGKIASSRLPALSIDVWDGLDCSELMKYIGDKSVGSLQLFNAYNIDFTKMPQVSQLEICYPWDLNSLEGIESLERLGTLILNNCKNLVSLKGLENAPRLYDVTLNGLSALKDVEGLYGLTLSNFHYTNMPELLMDFSKMNFGNYLLLGLEYIPLVENLDFLNAIPESVHLGQLSLNRLDNVQDAEPLLSKSGDLLTYPSQLQEQIEKASSMDLLNFNAIEKGEPCGRYDEVEIQVESLEELKTMSPLKKSFIYNFRLTGGAVLKQDEWSTEYWMGGVPVPYVDHATNEPYPAGNGSLQDLSLLEGMTSLENLELSFQPLKSIDGIQNFENLSNISLSNCDALLDISPLFALNNLRGLWLRRTGIRSIDGIQNLMHLSGLSISETDVTDLSPLKDVDYTEACSQDGFELEMDGLKAEDYSALSSIPNFRRLSLSIYDKDLAENANWQQYVENAQIRELEARNWSFLDNESLKTFAAAHPELEYIGLSWNEVLTDLTPLLDLPNLTHVKVSFNMDKAIDSLSGKQYSFELEIEG